MEKTTHTKQKEELAKALEVLTRASMRKTLPRKKILQTLILHHGPFSVDEIRKLKELKDLDRVTIYRCLSRFEEMKLVQRCEFGDGVSRYEYARKHHHHHVICRSCGSFENINRCIPNALVKEVCKMGYTDVSHNLEFFGICKRCSI